MKKPYSILGLASAACLLAAASVHAAAPTVADMLAIKPKFDDVSITTPTADEMKTCKVEDVAADGKTVGYAFVDSKKQLLRRYVMSKGSPQINVWSFFKEGGEVFRQIDSNVNNKVDQYRWLGAAGLKWGIDNDEDGKIDTWHMISADEVANEAFQALSNGDFARVRSLFISPAEIRALGLPEASAAKAVHAQKALAKFQQTLAKQPKLARANLVRVENTAPGCYLAESLGTPKDVIKHASLSIMYETATKDHDWLQVGEIVQVGQVWRLVDLVPDLEGAVGPTKSTGVEHNKLLTELTDVDKQIGDTPNPHPAQPHAQLAALYEQRAAIAEGLVKVADATEKETWYKQMLDSYSSAAIAGSEKAKGRLDAYTKQLVAQMPGTGLAGYATYRNLWAHYSPLLANAATAPKAQEAYHEQLAKFVKDYSKAEDTPDALHQLGMHCEFAGTKEKEEEAAKWYQYIHANFPTHHLAEWAKGAERRLRLTGRPLQLSGTLNDNSAFDVNQLKGKVVIVYYWASHCKECAADFARLKQVLSTRNTVELVCVNLDSRVADATGFLQQNAIAARHLVQGVTDTNGLRGAMATYYGVNVLPTVFLVGRDGLVLNTKVQVADLEEALKKAE